MTGNRKLLVAILSLGVLLSLAMQGADPGWAWGIVAVCLGWQAPRAVSDVAGILATRKEGKA